MLLEKVYLGHLSRLDVCFAAMNINDYISLLLSMLNPLHKGGEHASSTPFCRICVATF